MRRQGERRCCTTPSLRPAPGLSATPLPSREGRARRGPRRVPRTGKARHCLAPVRRRERGSGEGEGAPDSPSARIGTRPPCGRTCASAPGRAARPSASWRTSRRRTAVPCSSTPQTAWPVEPQSRPAKRDMGETSCFGLHCPEPGGGADRSSEGALAVRHWRDTPWSVRSSRRLPRGRSHAGSRRASAEGRRGRRSGGRTLRQSATQDSAHGRLPNEPRNRRFERPAGGRRPVCGRTRTGQPCFSTAGEPSGAEPLRAAERRQPRPNSACRARATSLSSGKESMPITE
jgi:hypothetical protein